MRLTVRKKLVFAFSVLIILMGVLGAFSISSIILVDKEIDDLYERDLKGIEHIKTAEANLIAISRARNNMILSTEGAERARHAENMKLLFQKFEKSLEDFNGTIVGEEARQRLDEILKIWEQLKPNEEKVIDLAINSTIEESHAQVMKNRAITDQIESEMNTLVNIKNEQASKAIKESDLAYVKIRNIIMIIITLSILIGIGIAFYMSNTIAKPIARMSEVASKIADGDLSIQEIKVRTNDEIGELGKSFNTMTESLRAVIKQVLDASEQVAASSEELSASSEEITSATEEVATAINQLAIGASKQAEDASKVSMGVNEIASGIDEVAKNANSVSITSVNVSKEATNGFNEAKIAVEKVERIKQVTEESAKGVRILGDESVKIGQIVEVIKDIADQTNLLALNAAIEAARAGEQGRGFAVVADEVSKLAEQSSVSALQIGELIGNVQSETKRVIDAMDVTTQEVLDGVVAVNKTGKYFELIFNEINDVTNQIQEVNIASQKIAGGSQYLDESIESIAAIAEETAASSEEVSASSEEQTSAMEEISDAAHELSRLAEELQVNVSRFKI